MKTRNFIQTCVLMCMLLGSITLFAQTKSETIDWLNNNKKDFIDSKYQLIFYNGEKLWSQKIEFNDQSIDFFDKDNNQVFHLLWKDITQITSKGISSVSLSFNKEDYIYLNIAYDNHIYAERVSKALTNAAKLSGAKLINPDLF